MGASYVQKWLHGRPVRRATGGTWGLATTEGGSASQQLHGLRVRLSRRQPRSPRAPGELDKSASSWQGPSEPQLWGAGHLRCPRER